MPTIVVVGLDDDVVLIEVVELIGVVEARVSGSVTAGVVGVTSFELLLCTATAINVTTSVMSAAAPSSTRSRRAPQPLGGDGSSGPATCTTGLPASPGSAMIPRC